MLPTEEETRLWIALNRAHRRIHREMERALAAGGLPPLKWYDVLWGIEMAGSDGVRASNLRDWLLFEQSNLSRVLRNLIERGLVHETVCDADKRAKILRVTGKGAELRLRMWHIYGPQIHAHMNKLTADKNAGVLRKALRPLQPDDE
ncbi:MarR family winged helix-turn-helix transcriptional regulator [Ruegeria sp. 2012CJ41-6]|uniref:MarR family winged helix-turn-helix transcriptional regulator n=1 Tax=Ruegeria spongiae TaxID=2942209 RepID=A0ABT0Q2J1_9RHOB|nr:MarR family winged helix-turn-helix transcriptional regulator [Ruegeria spongiae]MCL6283363.1 MarR family winged helix-turn-helix transcriptional regulator [Ruegeria spongiae]